MYDVGDFARQLRTKLDAVASDCRDEALSLNVTTLEQHRYHLGRIDGLETALELIDLIFKEDDAKS